MKLNTSIFSRNRPLTRLFTRAFGLLLALQIGAHALYQGTAITALRVANNSIVLDGRPDASWRLLSTKSSTTLNFNDYSKIVLLQTDAIRNANPANYYTAPAQGFVTMLAAYDDFALYFYFFVKENTSYNPINLCTVTNLWKANATEVYIDPSPWDVTNYRAYFSVDGTGLLFGTSPKTVQLDKPIYTKDTRVYFRNRLTSPSKFQIPASIPSGVVAMASAHSPADSLLIGVEMKIPFWTGSAPDFQAGKSMFISWGYNHYPNAGKANCDSTPIAYRWAKHYLSYSAGDSNKPVGWRAGDSTHFDPTRSWDGWGRFNLSKELIDPSSCTFPDTASWDLAYWKSRCSGSTTLVLRPKGVSNGKMPPVGNPFLFDQGKRDVKGRVNPGSQNLDLNKVLSP